MTTKPAIAMSVFLLAACGGAPSSEETTSTEQDALVSRTVVSFDAHGVATVKEDRITRAQQLAEIEERQRFVDAIEHPEHGIQKTSAATSLDGSCSGSSLWMFDGENLTGNEICFTGQGNADLSQYHDGAMTCGSWYCFWPTWSKHVRSLWAGSDTGYLYPCMGWKAFERRNTLAQVEKDATWLYLTTYTCPIN